MELSYFGGVWKYILENNFDVMIGCASFQATEPEQIGMALSFPSSLRVSAEEMAC